MELLLLFLFTTLMMTSSSSSANQPSTCQTKCGEVDIPYPFGIGDGCYSRDYPGDFSINCSDSIPYLGSTRIPLIYVDIFAGEVRVNVPTGYDCYNARGTRSSSLTGFGVPDPFTFSHRKNLFMAVGCDTYARINGNRGVSYSGGCISYCQSPASFEGMDTTRCSGLGCCQVAIPRGLKSYTSQMDSYHNYSKTRGFDRCGYTFMVEEGEYEFNVEDLSSDELKTRTLVLSLDWSIGNLTCEVANMSRTVPYACRSENSVCVESNNGIGYYCNCDRGYEGNPYLQGGCVDQDECATMLATCPDNSTCVNTDGSYTCDCGRGYQFIDEGSGSTRCEDIDECKENPCSPGEYCENTQGSYECKSRESSVSLGLKLGLGIGGGLLVLLAVSACTCWGLQRRNHKEQAKKMAEFKKRMFEQNGGPILQQQISSLPGTTFRIFTEEELIKATEDFADKNILGRGGHGVVYLGKLEDNTAVAVKKSKMMDERDSKEFAREMTILSQVNHVNVVKILGCCVEVEVPMLVYEFVPGGTLYNLIHGRQGTTPISFWDSLRIAREVAEALAYLHTYASPPIVHKDIKTSNVLLDENYRAKISDFGASSVAPVDENEIATVVQGTWGYLDPEYLSTYHFSDKSDVYSFGVVLAELLTRKKPLQLFAPEDERGLAATFTSFLNQGKLENILDPHIVKEVDADTLREFCELTCRCLCLKREERPSMKEVSMALQNIGPTHEHPWVLQHSLSETRSLFDSDEPMALDSSDILSGYSGTGYHTVHDIEAAR